MFEISEYTASFFGVHFFYKKNIENQLLKEWDDSLAKVRMGLLLFTTCFPLYIFGSAKTEWTISAGLPIFFSIVNWWSGSLTPSLVIVWPQESMIFSRLVWPTFGRARQGLWQEGGWQLMGWDGLLCKGIRFGEVFLLDEHLLRLSEWRDSLKVGDLRLECHEGRSSFFYLRADALRI